VIFTSRSGCSVGVVLAGVLAVAGALYGADGSAADAIQLLREEIAAQKSQLATLEETILKQQQLLERLAASQSSLPAQPAKPSGFREVASLRPVLSSPAPPIHVTGARTGGEADNPCEQGYEGNAVLPYIRLGKVCMQPVGFMDFTAVWRDKDAGSGIGTNFGSIPYNNSNPAAKLSEFRCSPQNSRIGFRIDGNWKGSHFVGYNEFDFLSSATPASAGVSNGAFVPRLRLFWLDVRKGKWELLGGQSWSMMVPNRTGISALPSDLFYSQVIDVNYVAGLPWDRQPGVRVLYHLSDKVTMGLSVENPNQYSGGSAGGSGITLPAALGTVNGGQLDNTTGNYFTTPNLMPDIVGKIAFDPNSKVHVEIAGLGRAFKIWNPASATMNLYSTAAGVGGAFNANLAIAKGLRLVTNNFYGSGVGRYLFGQTPDVVVQADGGLKTIPAAGFVQGLEWTHSKWQWYGYYGSIYVDRQALLDANGKTPIGYGYTGSPSSQNRSIQEITFGFNESLWRDVRYGALNFMGQYEYMLRHPWSVATGAPDAAHDNTIYLDFRYTLPGSMPKF
jgi:hypothetical protein